MASSSAPKTSSSVSTPPLALGSTEERFKAKLVALIDVAIGFVEGLHEASDKKISGIAEQDMDDLELNKWYLDTKTEPTFYAISYEHKKSSDEEIWDSTLPENLKLPALFTQQCSKIVYCLLPVIRDILGDDTDFDKVVWSRVYIDMTVACFDVAEDGSQVLSPLPFFAHDLFTVHTKEKTRYAVDITGQQYGIEEWFQIRKDYSKNVLDQMPPNPSSEDQKAAEIEAEGPQMPHLRTAISQLYKEVQLERAREGITWQNFHLLDSSKQKELRKSLVALTRARIVEALATSSTA